MLHSAAPIAIKFSSSAGVEFIMASENVQSAKNQLHVVTSKEESLVGPQVWNGEYHSFLFSLNYPA
jgi:hypothetical protein